MKAQDNLRVPCQRPIPLSTDMDYTLGLEEHVYAATLMASPRNNSCPFMKVAIILL